MLQKQTLTAVLIAGLAGFLDGILSQSLGLTVLAQTGAVEKIEAQEFRLVDEDGRTLGVLKAEVPAMQERIHHFQSQGGVVVGTQNGALTLFDSLGRTVWTAPQTVEPPARVQPLTESR